MKIMKKSLLVSAIAAVMTLYPVTALAESQTDPTNESSAVTSTTTDTGSGSSDTSSSNTTPEATPPASDPAPTPSTSTPSTETQGSAKPTGADANKYVYNPETGMYENDYYIWNPATKQTTPKTMPTYSYNPATGMWDTTEWVYDAPSGKYIPNTVSTPVAPADAVQDTDSARSVAPALTGSNIDNTGPDSTNNGSTTTTNTGIFDTFYNASISNNLTQNAVSGNVLLSGNTTVGNGTSGDATNLANIINMLQSTWSPLAGGTLSTFTATIDGDVTGDLYIDPASISHTGSNSNNSLNNTGSNNLTVNTATNGTITNNVDLNATTGDVAVTGNTTGGNATSGNALAMANLVNAINSSIAAGRSFMGMINITGNLNGDILLPPEILNSLIASTGPGSSNSVANSVSNNVEGNVTTNQTINNNVTATATTGTAEVSHNTTGGNATSGNATTQINILNLTGKEVVGKDALLVFVNVLGKWTGLIMNAPQGSTAAALGGGIVTNTGADSTNTATNTTSNNMALNALTNQTINNNVHVNAASGDASVTDNTTGGNATSGNATAAVNIANINTSNLSFSDWFGILFINVFGTWNGSFGINTDAGNTPAPTTPTPTPETPMPQTFTFVSKETAKTKPAVVYATVTTPAATDETAQQPAPAVLSDSDSMTPTTSAATTAASPRQMSLMWVPFAGSFLGLLILITEEIIRRRRAAQCAETQSAIAL